jgi:hypothetical protein
MDYVFGCGDREWGDAIKDCAVSCLWAMLPVPDPCGKFGKLFGAAVGLASGLMNSFPADTLVHTRIQTDSGPQTQLKRIADIQIGDEVLAWDELAAHDQSLNQQSYQKVTEVYNTPERIRTLVHLTLDNGQTLTATDGHPFKTEEGWRDAVLLKKGGKLLLKDSSYATIAEVRIEQERITTYNLEVAQLHTYLVGRDGVVVHNSGGARIPCGSPRSAFRQAKRDAGIPTSQTHNTHRRGQGDRQGSRGTDYGFDNNKSVQHHPDGHPYPATNGSNEPHFNNHQPPGVPGGTKNHYTY